MKKYERNKNGVKHSWILSYVFILLVPVFITSILFIGIERIVYKKITNMNEHILSQIQGNLDNMFESIYKNGLQVEFSPEISAVFDAEEKNGKNNNREDSENNENTGNETAYLFYNLQKNLKQYVTYNDYIQDMAIYFDTSSYVVTSQSTYDKTLSKEFLSRYNMTEENWTYLTQLKKRGFYILNSETYKGQLIYTAPLLHPSTKKNRAYILIFPEKKYLAQRIPSLSEESNRAVFLMEGNHFVPLINSEPETEWKFQEYLQQTNNDSGEFSDKQSHSFRKRKEIHSILDSDYSELKYVIIDQYEETYKELQLIQGLILASMVGSIGLGIWCAMYFARKNYTPMKELITSVSSNVGIGQEHDMNEYIFLSNVISKTVESKEEAEMQIALIKLLRGFPITDKLRKQVFQDTNYVVVVFAIEDARDFFHEENLVSDSYRLLSFVVSNCMQDFFSENFHLFDLIEIDRYLVQIIGLPQKSETNTQKEAIWQTLEKLHLFFNDSLKITLSISIGSIFSKAEELTYSYEQAKEAMEYRMMMGNNVIIDYENLTGLSLSYDYSIENETDILNSLKNGNFEQVRDYIFAVIDSNTKSGMMSAQLARCMMFDMVATIMKGLSLTRLDTTFLGHLNPIERLLQCETFEQMKQELSDILNQVCNYINSNQENPNRKLFDRITAYVETNYMDENLNVSTLSAGLFVSKSFLVKLFKDNLGLTPLDYINRFRCERGLMLLGRQEYTIEEIAKKVGYGNSHTFIRIFKKIYGKTPGAYRTMLLNEETTTTINPNTTTDSATDITADADTSTEK